MATIKIQIGLTIKEISKQNKRLNIKSTVNFKTNSIEHIEKVGVIINKEDEKIPNYRNSKKEKFTEIVITENDRESSMSIEGVSKSFHINHDLILLNEIDFCPFKVSKYSLQFKLNSPIIDDKKYKSVFVQRKTKDFIQFQENSLTSEIDKNSLVSVVLIVREKEKNLSRLSYNQGDSIFNLNDTSDEIYYNFTIKSNEIQDVVTIIIPNLIISIVICEVNRQGLMNSNTLLTALFPLIITMPKEITLSKMTYYMTTITITSINYMILNSGLYLDFFSILLFGMIALINYRMSRNKIYNNKHETKVESLIKYKSLN
jgi:hypothetical protein